MKKTVLLFLFLVIANFKSFSQSTLITPGSTQPNISATSTLNGVVFPRMTTAQKDAITNLSVGTIIYDTDLSCLSLYVGNGWTCLNPATASNGPTFQNFQLTMNPSGNAPLAGKITVSSNQKIKLSYTVKGQDGEDFSFSNDKFSAANDTTINLYGLYPDFTNTITATITSLSGQVSQKTFYVKTDHLPVDLPQSNEIIVNVHNSNILTKFILNLSIKCLDLNKCI